MRGGNQCLLFFLSKVVRCAADTNSNIRRHLALSHGKMQLACKSHRLPRSKISPEKKRQLDEVAINCIIADGRSWGDFQRPGMSRFLSVATPGYTGPSSRTVQRKLSKLYLEKHRNLKEEIAQVPSVSITIDLWRSARRDHYLCITMHWLDGTFNLQGKVLSFRKFKGRHLAKRIRVHMKRVFLSYDLVNKITATTTDNGSNVKAATTSIQLFGVRFHCLAHALNLTIHNGLRLWPKKPSASIKTKLVDDR